MIRTFEELKRNLMGICAELEDSKMAQEENWPWGAVLCSDGFRIVGEYVADEWRNLRNPFIDTEVREMVDYLIDEYKRYSDGDRSNELTRGRFGFELRH